MSVSSPFSFRLVASGRFPGERDPEYAAHVAHGMTPPFWMPDRARRFLYMEVPCFDTSHP